eukprot:jgi/Mesvir1/20675/Mv14888-RA.2
MDDAFSDDGDEDLAREQRSRESRFHNVGYRDGFAEGSNSALQDGFNEGYGESSQPGLRWGRMVGALAAARMLGPRLGATQESLTAADELACRMAAVSGPNLFCAEVLRPATSSAPTLSLHTAPAALGARVPHPSNAACTDGACKVVVTDAVAGDGAGPCHCQGGMPDTAVSGSAAMAPRESSGGSGGKSEQGPWLGTSLESFRAEGLQLLSQGFGVSLDVDKIELN